MLAGMMSAVETSSWAGSTLTCLTRRSGCHSRDTDLVCRHAAITVYNSNIITSHKSPTVLQWVIKMFCNFTIKSNENGANGSPLFEIFVAELNAFVIFFLLNCSIHAIKITPLCLSFQPSFCHKLESFIVLIANTAKRYFGHQNR